MSDEVTADRAGMLMLAMELQNLCAERTDDGALAVGALLTTAAGITAVQRDPTAKADAICAFELAYDRALGMLTEHDAATLH